MSGFSLIWFTGIIAEGAVDMQKSAIWATISLVIVGMGIIFYALNYERYPVKPDTLAKSDVIETYIAQKYGDEFGWTVRQGRKIESEEKLSLLPEVYAQSKNAGMDLETYDGKFVHYYVFPLLPICQKNGEEQGVELIVYEHNGQFIGDVMSSLNSVGGPRKTLSKDEWLAEGHCK